MPDPTTFNTFLEAQARALYCGNFARATDGGFGQRIQQANIERSQLSIGRHLQTVRLAQVMQEMFGIHLHRVVGLQQAPADHLLHPIHQP